MTTINHGLLQTHSIADLQTLTVYAKEMSKDVSLVEEDRAEYRDLVRAIRHEINSRMKRLLIK